MIRVLVVDDSQLYRETIRLALEAEPGFEVVGEAADGEVAIAETERLKPDVVTLDLRMPRFSGVECIPRLLAMHPARVLVLADTSSHQSTRAAFEALSRGAVDLFAKPHMGWNPEDGKSLAQRLNSIVSGSGRRGRGAATLPSPGELAAAPASTGDFKLTERPGIIVAAASTGGPSALARFLARLPRELDLPIAVIQHIDAGFIGDLAIWLSEQTGWNVSIAKPGAGVGPGEVLLGAPGMDFRLTRNGLAILESPPPRALHIPSADVLFSSVAAAYRSAAVGVLLTGAGNDGTKGLLRMREAGALTIAQDEASSVLYGMPRAAVEADAACHVISLDEIGPFIANSVRKLTGPAAAGPMKDKLSVTAVKILVVDDSPIVLESAKLMLESAGYHVATTDNPITVSSVIMRLKPNLVLLDVNMPAIHGDEVAKLVAHHKLGANTVVLLHSSIPEDELRLRAQSCGAAGYICKTMDETQFLRQVKTWVGKVKGATT